MKNITAEHAVEVINILRKASPEVAEAVRIAHEAVKERDEKAKAVKEQIALIDDQLRLVESEVVGIDWKLSECYQTINILGADKTDAIRRRGVLMSRRNELAMQIGRPA